MTLLLAYVLFWNLNYGSWWYFGTFWLWLAHLAYHHVDLSDLKSILRK